MSSVFEISAKLKRYFMNIGDCFCVNLMILACLCRKYLHYGSNNIVLIDMINRCRENEIRY